MNTPIDTPDLTVHRCEDGRLMIDRAPDVVHVLPELVDELRRHGQLTADGYWVVGTPGRGAGCATYQTDGTQDDEGAYLFALIGQEP
jgi:hypothetical protein